MMLYLKSNSRPDISFAVHQCEQFTHNIKESHDMDVKRICQYIQGTKGNSLLFNLPKKLVVNFYSDADFAGLCGHENPQGLISASNRTGFVVTFDNFPPLWV